MYIAAKITRISSLFTAAFEPPLVTKQYLKMFTTDVVRVKVLGYPKPTITWKDKDGKNINLALSKYELLSDGSLKINSVNRKDSGKYTCRLEQKPRTVNAVIDVIATCKYHVL